MNNLRKFGIALMIIGLLPVVIYSALFIFAGLNLLDPDRATGLFIWAFAFGIAGSVLTVNAD